MTQNELQETNKILRAGQGIQNYISDCIYRLVCKIIHVTAYTD